PALAAEKRTLGQLGATHPAVHGLPPEVVSPGAPGVVRRRVTRPQPRDLSERAARTRSQRVRPSPRSARSSSTVAQSRSASWWLVGARLNTARSAAVATTSAPGAPSPLANSARVAPELRS